MDTTGSRGKQAARAEQSAASLVAIALALICLYVLVMAVWELVTRARPEASFVGISKVL